MKKFILDLVVAASEHIQTDYMLLKLTTEDGSPLPEMLPGQFVEVLIENSPRTFLRRPISINYVDRVSNQLWLLVHVIGEGTRTMASLVQGDRLNLVFPLGKGFSIPGDLNSSRSDIGIESKCVSPDTHNEVLSSQNQGPMLLVGGGVGTAPLLYLGAVLNDAGFEVVFLLGARSASDILQADDFLRFGSVYYTTEDGSLGEKGYVTQHSILGQKRFSRIYSCGPKPMMMAVASYARKHQIECEVSLENMMACGLGACLCCVEKTTEGHLCVCKEGPVFNINQLTWQI